jgi:Glycosyl hydrolases family 15
MVVALDCAVPIRGTASRPGRPQRPDAQAHGLRALRAVVAAPTTSLPKRIGGVRNWDYHYCWLRDASLTLPTLHDLGYEEDARALLAWMLHSTRLTWPQLEVLYDVRGEARLPAREVSHLEGYAGSQPVRVGNGAAGQLQLDVYSEVVDAVFEFVRRGGDLDRATARMLIGLGEMVCRRCQEADEGIWEIRGGRRHHAYSPGRIPRGAGGEVQARTGSHPSRRWGARLSRRSRQLRQRLRRRRAECEPAAPFSLPLRRADVVADARHLRPGPRTPRRQRPPLSLHGGRRLAGGRGCIRDRELLGRRLPPPLVRRGRR